MSKEEDWVVVGRFGRPHGIKGFVTIYSFTEPYDNILTYNDWYAFLDRSWQPIKLLSAQMRNKAIVAQLEGYSEREAATLLTNVEIAIRKDQLAPLEAGEYYWHQLVGMNVVNQHNESFGTVVEIMPTGSNDVLVVQGDKKHLIPYLPGQYIIHINNEAQVITVDWDMDF